MLGSIFLAALAMSNFQNVKLMKNYDGDTFTITLDGLPSVFGYDIPVRIRGIDTAEVKAPELCQKYDAIQARDALYKVLDGKQIDLVNCERDKYFRLLCDVTVSGFIDVKAYMLSKGYAVSYDGQTKPRWTCRKVMP